MQNRIRRALLTIDGILESPGIFYDDDAYWVNGTQIAHFRDAISIEIRLTKANIRAQRDRLRKDPRVELRSGASDWIMVRWSSPRDAAFIAELADIAAAAHRAPSGTTAKPPPQGADLARRRRFH
jgi:hypothetical protein